MGLTKRIRDADRRLGKIRGNRRRVMRRGKVSKKERKLIQSIQTGLSLIDKSPEDLGLKHYQNE